MHRACTGPNLRWEVDMIPPFFISKQSPMTQPLTKENFVFPNGVLLGKETILKGRLHVQH